jgi:hypothetical protein
MLCHEYTEGETKMAKNKKDAVGVSEQISVVLSSLLEARKSGWFFPNGVDHLELTISLSPSAPSCTLKLDGPRSAPQPAHSPFLTFDTLAVSPKQKVINACTAALQDPNNAAACNKFLNAVVRSLTGANFDGLLANQIVDQITADPLPPPWSNVTGGTAAEIRQNAMDLADEGKLVIAGLRGNEMGQTQGHVVVLNGSGSEPGVPFGSWGTDSSSIRPHVNFHLVGGDPADPSSLGCFRRSVLDKLHYAWTSVTT